MNVRNLISLFESSPVGTAMLLACIIMVLLGAGIAAYVGIRAALDSVREKREARLRREMRRVEHERLRRKEK